MNLHVEVEPRRSIPRPPLSPAPPPASYAHSQLSRYFLVLVSYPNFITN
jgi:hypothetical protein